MVKGELEMASGALKVGFDRVWRLEFSVLSTSVYERAREIFMGSKK